MIIKDGKVLLTFEASIRCVDKIYFAEMSTNGIYEYDIGVDEARLMCSIIEESGERLFGSIIKEKQLLYLIPLYADAMYKVDIISGEYEKIELPFVDKESAGAKFMNAVIYDGTIYMFPMQYRGILKYNIYDEVFITWDNWVDNIYNKLFEPFLFRNIYYDQNYTVYAPCCGSNVIFEFDLQKNDYRLHKIGNGNHGFSGIDFDGDNFWLSPRKPGPIIKWNGEDSFREITSFPDGFVLNYIEIGGVACFEKQVYLYPWAGDKLIKIENDIMDICSDNARKTCYCFSEDSLFLFCTSQGELVKINADAIVKKNVYAPKNSSIAFLKSRYNIDKNNIFMETSEKELEAFILFVTNANNSFRDSQ